MTKKSNRLLNTIPILLITNHPDITTNYIKEPTVRRRHRKSFSRLHV